MAKELLREFYALCPDGNCVLDVLTESEKKRMNEGSVFLVGVCQKAGVKNGNGRIYRKDILQREIENYQKAIGERRALGELDHPDDSVINLKNASHKVVRIWWDGDDVIGVIQCLKTPSGQILEGLYKSGVKFGFSSRALGSLGPCPRGTGAQMVQDDLQLICFDVVSDPSTPGAFMNLTENKQPVEKIFTKADRINRALNEILLRRKSK